MKFKKGDKVRVRQWKAMEREYGLNIYGCIKTEGVRFARDMRVYCGKVVTVSEVWDDYYKIEEDNGAFKWTDDMFEGYAFEYGDKIEVRDIETDWKEAIYIGFADGAVYPYICVSESTESDFCSGKGFIVSYWKHARPIQRHRIVIDGKEIEISEESYKKLKESLLK